VAAGNSFVTHHPTTAQHHQIHCKKLAPGLDRRLKPRIFMMDFMMLHLLLLLLLLPLLTYNEISSCSKRQRHTDVFRQPHRLLGSVILH
jgi:hypothetical protein